MRQGGKKALPKVLPCFFCKRKPFCTTFIPSQEEAPIHFFALRRQDKKNELGESQGRAKKGCTQQKCNTERKETQRKKSLRFTFLFVQRHSLQNHERGGGRYKGHTKSLVSPLLWFRGSLTATFLFSFWREPLGEIRRCGAKVENCGPLTRAMQKGRRRRREGANLALLAFYAPPPLLSTSENPPYPAVGHAPWTKQALTLSPPPRKLCGIHWRGKGWSKFSQEKKAFFFFSSRVPLTCAISQCYETELGRKGSRKDPSSSTLEQQGKKKSPVCIPPPFSRVSLSAAFPDFSPPPLLSPFLGCD